MTADPPICYNCKNRTPKQGVGAFFCSAFPAGIPDAIINNVADHREPFEGDRGILYDPIDPSEPMPGFGPIKADLGPGIKIL